MAELHVSLDVINSQEQQSLPISEAKIITSKKEYSIYVELANTNKQRAIGLMNRYSMADNMGMLFDFKRSKRVSMWMRNTFIPLDMLFINKYGLIVNIHEEAVPESEETIDSYFPVMAVLELKAGTVDRLGIQIKDRVRHEIFDYK